MMEFYVRTVKTKANIKARSRESAIIKFLTENKLDYSEEVTLLIQTNKHIWGYRTIPIAVHLGQLTYEQGKSLIKSLITEGDDVEKALNRFLEEDKWVLQHLNRR